MLDIAPDQIRSAPAKVLKDKLSFPSYGMALDFKADTNWERVNSPLALLDEVELSNWLESHSLQEFTIPFLQHCVTGKGVEIVESTDLMEMGFTDVFFILPSTCHGDTTTSGGGSSDYG